MSEAVTVATSDPTWVAEDRASIDEVLAFANAVREAGGANPLDALVPGIPDKENACLIARNLNFSCSVFPAWAATDKQSFFNSRLVYEDGEVVWHMHIDDEAVIDTISERLGLPVDVDQKGNRVLRLPRKIGRVARAFDAINGYDAGREEVENPDELLALVAEAHNEL